MKYSDNIFQLIQSLNKQEKRYLTLYANKHVIGGKNDYLKLFEVINKYDSYDEEKIKRVLGKESLIKSFRVVKNHLYHHIINSLLTCHSGKTKESVLQNYLSAVEILFGKGLLEQTEKLLSKAKKIAYQYEKYAKLLDILAWEKKLIVAKSYADISSSELQQVYKEELTILEKISIVNTFWYQAHHTFLILNRKGVTRIKDDEINELPPTIESQDFEINDKATPYKAKVFDFHLKGVYYYAKGDLEKSYTSRKKLVQLMETFPQHIQQTPTNYLIALQDLLIVCSKLKKYDEFQSLLKKLRLFSIDRKTEQPIDIQVKIFVISYILELDMFNRKGEFEKGVLLIRGIESKLKQFEDKISTNEKLALFANIVYLWFGVANYHNALKWLNRIFNDITTEIREDIYADANIIHLIIHYELGNIDALKYFVRATRHYFIKKEHLFQFETIILDFFQKLPQIKRQNKNSFKILKKQLRNITKDPFERKALEYFDYISWIDSKIEDRAFAEVVREKAEKEL